MLPSFTSTWFHKVDTKGRVSIPAPFRRVLEEGDAESGPKGDSTTVNPRVVIIRGGRKDKHLEAFTIQKRDHIAKLIAKIPMNSDRRRHFDNKYHANSDTISIDENGRMVLSAALREKIGLSKEAVFVGNGEIFQIWEPADYAAEQERYEEYAEANPDIDETLDPYVLEDQL